MRKCTAFVLSGGGSRGALQIGALRALLEAGMVPDLLETQIAEMQGVPVHRIDFQGLAKTPMLDFSDYRALRQAGYKRAKKVIAEWGKEPQTDLSSNVPARVLSLKE